MKTYDLIVIGSGSAGGKVAFGCAEAGWKVAVIDKQPFGGTCAQRGCDPKKILVGASEIIHRMGLMEGKGIKRGNARISWKKLMKFKRTFTRPVPKNNLKKYSKLGIAAFEGTAKFTERTTIEVNNKHLKAGKIVLASGYKTMELNIPGEKYAVTSTDFLELEKLPRNILFIGGGYISMEFAHIASIAGAKVQILEAMDRPLNGFDPDLVDMLVRSSKESGIKFNLNTKVTRLEKKKKRFIVYAENNGKKKIFQSDLVVNAAGRFPDIDELNLEAAGVQREKKGISVNEFLQSVSNQDVYAAGDCAAAKGALPLTPIAGKEGSIVLQNLLNGNEAKVDFDVIPTVVFTNPPLASAGLLEDDAKRRGLKFKTVFQDTSGWYSSKRIGLKNTCSKVLIEEGTGKIIGAHLLHHHAEDIINLFAYAIKFNLTSEQIKHFIYTYPTSSYDIPYMV